MLFITLKRDWKSITNFSPWFLFVHKKRWGYKLSLSHLSGCHTANSMCACNNLLFWHAKATQHRVYKIKKSKHIPCRYICVILNWYTYIDNWRPNLKVLLPLFLSFLRTMRIHSSLSGNLCAIPWLKYTSPWPNRKLNTPDLINFILAPLFSDKLQSIPLNSAATYLLTYITKYFHV